VIYYTSMFRCWQLVRNLIKTNHPYLRLGHHSHTVELARGTRHGGGMSGVSTEGDDVVDFLPL
jgi:hypothetical protein